MTILSRLVAMKEAINGRGETYGLIAIAFAIVIGLEYLTPPEYVFGYLYTGTILLADSRLSRKAVLGDHSCRYRINIIEFVYPRKRNN